MSEPITPVAEILPPLDRAEHDGSDRVHSRLRSTLLKDMVMEAADRVGKLYAGDEGSAIDYLAMLALTEPRVFGSLLARVLPLQVNVNDPAGRTSNITRIENVVMNAPAAKEPGRVHALHVVKA